MALGRGTVQAAQPPEFTTVCFGSPVAGSCVPQTVPLPDPPNIPKINLQISVFNPDSAALTQVTYVVHLGPGLKIAAPSGLTPPGFCGGTVVITGTAPNETLTLSGANIAAGGLCKITVDVVGISAGTKTVTIDGLGSFESGPAPPQGPPYTATAAVDVLAPPVIKKLFSKTKIRATTLANPCGLAPGLDCKSTVTITMTNPTGNMADIKGVILIDSFGTNLALANPPNASFAGCASGAAFSPLPAAGTGSVTFNNPTLPSNPNTTCTIQFDVVGIAVGRYKNNAVAGSSNTLEGRDDEDIIVVGPPTLSKRFNPRGIKQGGTTTLSFTLDSNNSDSEAVLTGITFTDDLPAGFVVTSPSISGANAVCGGQLNTTLIGGTRIQLTGATLSPGTPCPFSLNVTGNAPIGLYTNTTSTITSNEGGTGDPATAPIAILQPLLFEKSFRKVSDNTQVEARIPLDGTTKATAQFFIKNPNVNVTTAQYLSLNFVDTLPPGLKIASPIVASIVCIGVAAPPFAPPLVAGGDLIQFNIPIFGALAECTAKVEVIGTDANPNAKLNTANVTSSNGPPATSQATILVVAPPTLTKKFDTANNPMSPGGTNKITFTLGNPNNGTVPLTGVGFLDTFPPDMKVANPSNASNTCGIPFNPAVGALSINPTNITLAPGASCIISVDVTATTGGDLINRTDPIISTEGGPGGRGQDTLTVISPPRIEKSFLQPNPVTVTGDTTMKFVITNNNTSLALMGIGFLDVMPPGLLIATTGSATNTCGGMLTALPGTQIVTLTGGTTLAAGGMCMVTIPVTATTIGDKINNVTVTSTNAGTGNTSTATLFVNPILPPVLGKIFVPNLIAVFGTSTMTITVSNVGNTIPLTGVNFTDTFPDGLFVASPNGLSTNCPLPGIVTAVPNSNTVTLSGATLLPPPGVGSSCTITLTVKATTPGDKVNTVAASSTNGGTGTPGSATLRVISSTEPPILTKSFATKFVLPGAVVALTFNLRNPSSFPMTDIAFTDTLPSGFLVNTPNGLTNTCGGTVTALQGTPIISLSGVSLLAGASCTLKVDVLAPVLATPTYICNTTSTVTWSGAPPEGNPATTCITVGPNQIAPPGAFQIRYASNLDRGDSLINLSNNGANGSPLNGPGYGFPVGNICINAYAFSPDEQLISCCSCLVTPNGLNSLSVREDLTSNTLTGVRPNSVVIKLLASQPVGSTCNAATPNFMNFAPGMHAWGTTIHPGPTGKLEVTETPFSNATLHEQELLRLTGLCANNLGNGSGFGICRTCRNSGFAPELIGGSPTIR